MRSFSNFIKIVLCIFSISIFAQNTADLKPAIQTLPAWIENPTNDTERFVAAMLTSSAGAKNWVYCYRCAFGRTDVDKKITKKNCLEVYKIWDEQDRETIKTSCH